MYVLLFSSHSIGSRRTIPTPCRDCRLSTSTTTVERPSWIPWTPVPSRRHLCPTTLSSSPWRPRFALFRSMTSDSKASSFVSFETRRWSPSSCLRKVHSFLSFEPSRFGPLPLSGVPLLGSGQLEGLRLRVDFHSFGCIYLICHLRR